MIKLTKDIKLYTKLLLSVGLQGKKGGRTRRPLPPLECAQLIKRLMDEDNLTKSQVSERLDLGRPEEGTNIYEKRDTTQVGLFLKLLEISPKSQQVAGWGYEGPPKISFTILFRLASLPHDEQDIVIQSKHKKGIATKQAIQIATLRRENPNLSINEIVETVLKIKAIDAPHHMIVCEVNEKLGNFIKSNDDHVEKLLEILRKNINGEFFELDANEIIISIKMDETAFKTFHEQQSNEGVQFTEFLNGFLEDKLG